jgi:hypothetical protein
VAAQSRLTGNRLSVLEDCIEVLTLIGRRGGPSVLTVRPHVESDQDDHDQRQDRRSELRAVNALRPSPNDHTGQQQFECEFWHYARL